MGEDLGQLAFNIGFAIALIVLVVMVIRFQKKHPEISGTIKADLAKLGTDAQTAAPLLMSDAIGYLESLRDHAKAEWERLDAAVKAAKEHKP